MNSISIAVILTVSPYFTTTEIFSMFYVKCENTVHISVCSGFCEHARP